MDILDFIIYHRCAGPDDFCAIVTSNSIPFWPLNARNLDFVHSICSGVTTIHLQRMLHYWKYL